ncbi:solute carrier family 35 member c2 [Plakobranchus ocellatus]|uniref:Solute carrier family 35 member c2 n=1 Tax=Plakobranchus ocellatus TaxID=259542 RepID=A0AAV4C238_9GAST|nr:solute carrier family 35 member c2 [Plakobranchus ocellatus]
MAKKKKVSFKRQRQEFLELKSTIKEQEQRVKASLCSVAFFVSALKTLGLVLFYYIFSIGLTFYNRKMFKGGNAALSITMCHLLLKFVAATIVRQLMECRSDEPRVTLAWGPYIRRIAAPGLVSSLDIGLSNWSFEMITVSLYTMSKTTAVIFILFFSILFKLEKFRWSLVLVVLCIFSGLFMFTYHSTQFNMEGFVLVMSASVLAGMRWTLAQLVMQKNEIGLHNPVDMMYHMQPWMILALLPLSAGLELQTISTTELYFRFTDWSVLMSALSMILLGGALGFMLEFSEFLLLSHTSSLTLSISGIFKELCIFALAYFVNHDQMNAVNAIGLVVCLLGIIVHVITKAVYRNEERDDSYLNGSPESVEMLSREGRSGGGDDYESDDEVDVFSVDMDRRVR